MEYVDYEFFNSIYDGIKVEEFVRHAWDAKRIVDAHTTGIDNVRKLKVAFPTDEDDAEAVKRCVCKLIKLMHDIEAVEKSRGYVAREDGTVMGGVISSVSSGTETISYATNVVTSIDAAVSDLSARNALFSQTVRTYLSGVKDANGVNLLYMGVYPYVL